jgi:hypothetical protein
MIFLIICLEGKKKLCFEKSIESSMIRARLLIKTSSQMIRYILLIKMIFSVFIILFNHMILITDSIDLHLTLFFLILLSIILIIFIILIILLRLDQF